MERVPTEMLRLIGSYLDYKETLSASAVSKRFSLKRQRRKKRFKWCRHKVNRYRTPIRDGYCAVSTCGRCKAACIYIDIPKTVPLSNYCSLHAKQFRHSSLI